MGLLDAVGDVASAIAGGARDAVDTVADAVPDEIRSRAGDVARWAWTNKAELGFWVGTTALMLALPVTGSASGAVAGGLMAARGAAIASRVAQAGRVGLGAVRMARVGAAAVQGARAADGATRVGAAAVRTGGALHRARIALGGTSTGRAMLAAQRPVNAVATTIGSVNLADTARRASRGDAGALDLVLAAAGVAPALGARTSRIAATRALRAEHRAARIASAGLEDVAGAAGTARSLAHDLVRAAPAHGAYRSASAASAGADAADATARAATAARTTSTACTRDLAMRLDGHTRDAVLHHAQVQERAELVAAIADKARGAVGSTNLVVGGARNAAVAADAARSPRSTLEERSIVRSLFGLLLARTGRPR